MLRRTLLVLLLGVNLALVAAMLFITPGPPVAHAQGVAQGGNYIMVTGKVMDDYDALYLVDLNTRTLHVLTIDPTQRRLQYRGYRSLVADFRRATSPTAGSGATGSRP